MGRSVGFVTNAEGRTVDLSGLDHTEAAAVSGHRRWTPIELASTPDQIVPPDLRHLAARFVGGHLPSTPMRFAWHH